MKTLPKLDDLSPSIGTKNVELKKATSPEHIVMPDPISKIKVLREIEEYNSLRGRVGYCHLSE